MKLGRVTDGMRSLYMLQERLEARQEKREFLKSQRAIGLGDGDALAAEIAADSGLNAGAGEGSGATELATYDFEDTVITTTVTPLEPDEPECSRKAASATSAAGGEQRRSAVRKSKKFDLNLPLAAAIPGYKAPKGQQKSRKRAGNKKKYQKVSKKVKAKTRAQNQQRKE